MTSTVKCYHKKILRKMNIIRWPTHFILWCVLKGCFWKGTNKTELELDICIKLKRDTKKKYQKNGQH